MPINFDLESLRLQHNCKNYFETGLWDPRTENSSKAALSAGFDYVFCIEIRDDWVSLGKEVFRDQISEGRYHLLHDDSNNMKKYLNLEHFDEKTMFFLDAHVDNPQIRNSLNRCPIFNELAAIASLSRNDHVILVDDLRILRQTFPWGEKSYGEINFLEEIKREVLKINPHYQFTTLVGHVSNDVLMCSVKEEFEAA